MNGLLRCASVISHDLETPLAAVRGRIESAQATGEKEHFEAASRALDRADELREDVVEMLRAREFVSETDSVDIGTIAETVWQKMEMPPDASLEITGSPRIEADQKAIRRLLEDPYRNAVEHGDDSVTVTVGGRSDGFYVADDGPGIPEKNRDEVFEAGYTTTSEGTGFGLNIVEQIVEAHG